MSNMNAGAYRVWRLTNGHSKYSREPCLERLFFFKSEAIAYAAELDKNPKPYN